MSMSLPNLHVTLFCLSLMWLFNANAQYTYKIAPINPFDPVTINNYASPALVDIDDDGDLDLFVGQYDSNEMLFYRNTGTVSNPVYSKQTGSNNPLNNYFNNSGCCAPSFVDIDDDGDMDMFSGVWVNIIRYFRNDGNAMVPTFVYVSGAMNPLDQVYTEGICTFPAFVDIDGDLDTDVFITDDKGNILYYENTGNPNLPVFNRNDAGNPLVTAGLSTRSKIAFQDINGDGLIDAVIGHDISTPEVLYFENTGTKQKAKYIQRTGIDNPFRDISGQIAAIPVFGDIDNDTDKDLVLGSFQSVKLYEATKTTGTDHFSLEKPYVIYPNPTQNEVTITGSDLFLIEILNDQGKVLNRIINPLNKNKLDLPQNSKGIYFVRLVSKQGTGIEKIVVY